MIVFNIVFALAVLVAVRNLLDIKMYVKSLKYARSLAAMPAVKQALRDNRHHIQSSSRARDELFRFETRWLSLASSAVFILITSWFVGLVCGGELTDLGSLLSATALTIAIARPLTNPIQAEWLIPWLFGLQAVAAACRKDAIEKRMMELMSLEDIDTNESAHAELFVLYTELEKINAIIGTLTEQTQSGGSEQQ